MHNAPATNVGKPMLTRLTAVALIMAGLFTSVALSADLGAVLSEAAEGTDAPGAGLLTIRNYRIADETFYGVRRLGDAAAVAPSDLWNIGSDGKVMTAVMVARLVEKGMLSWDASLGALLPDMAADMRPEYRAVTLMQLMTHASGLPENIVDEDVLNSLLYDKSPTSPSERRKAYVARAFQDAPEERAGRFSYSNTGFLVAAVIAEKATGKTYESLMKDEVFKPLAMTSAGFGLTPADGNVGHIDGRVAIPRDANPEFFAPAGNIYLSLDDWARFCIDQLKGAAGQGALLKPQTYSLMQTAQSGSPVSMGWFIRDSMAGLSGPVLFHEGSDGTWFAVVALFPASGSGVLAVANAGKDMDGDDLTEAAGLSAARLLANGQ